MGRNRKSDSKSARSEEPEPYQPTGNFQTDFAELCKEAEICRPPAVIEHAQVPAGKKGKEDKKAAQQQQMVEPEEESPEEKAVMELLGFKPKTFSVKSHLELMKPCIQVEMDHPDRQDSVTEVFIKDWKLQAPMLLTLGRCFEKLQKLHSINLWRVAADASIVDTLAKLLGRLPALRSLSLESNGPVADEEVYAELIRVESNLTKLRLRFNQLSDKAVSAMAIQLDGLRETPSKLVSLDLSSNCIGDAGSLRTNRTLLHLSLSNNRLTDRSAIALAQVCSRFFLTHEETVQRRRLMSVDFRSGTSPPPSRKGADRPGSVRSIDKDKDKKSAAAAAKTGGKGKKDEKAKPDDKAKGKAASKEDPKAKGKAAQASEKDAKAGAKSGKGRGARVKVSTPQPEPEQVEVHFDSEHPLLERADASYAPGHLLVPGNYALALLNLSRNQITDRGVDEWKTAIKYQAAYMAKQKVHGTGMLKLMLQGNPFSTETDNYKALEDALNARDPLRPGVADN
uniref:Leucine-rich repeat-containing protein 71 n=1 Tax=Macrostomum lignano TaxID=282301 RepID=A0A1I8GXC7_9PLAT